MPTVPTFIITLIILITLMMYAFLIAQIKRNTTVVDVAWAVGIILVALLNLFEFSSFHERQILITLLTVLWGVRLALYIYLRNRATKEDRRYADLRKKWGDNFVAKSFFSVFMLQAFLLYILAFPIIIVNANSGAGFGLFDYLGVALWSLGFVIETIADYQKCSFKKVKGNGRKIITSGLWAYSRHPNYVGETLIWWGIFFIVVFVPYGFIAVVSPLLITFLLRRVTGIPLAEKNLKKNKEYIEYMEKTPAFFPKIIKR